MDEFHTLRAEGFGVGDEPAGEHRGKHGGGLWIAGLTAPDIQLFGVDRFNVSHGAAVEVIDVRRYRIRVLIDPDDAADDAVTHNGTDVFGIEPQTAQFTRGFSHTNHAVVKISVDIHFHPPRLRIGE